MKIKNPRHNNYGGIDVELFDPRYGWIPFTATPDDTVEHGRDIFGACMRGEFGDIAPAPAPPPALTEQDIKEAARKRLRERLVSAPPTDILERIRLLEISVGIRDPEEGDYDTVVD
jgi:hypothetical protein